MIISLDYENISFFWWVYWLWIIFFLEFVFLFGKYNLVDMVMFLVFKIGIVVNILKMLGDVIIDYYWSERVLKVFYFGISVKFL